MKADFTLWPVACLTLLSLFSTMQVAVSVPCSTDSQCGPRECCEIESEFIVVSKKRVPSQFILAPVGTCESYDQLGETCGPFDKINGRCGCAPGLECRSASDSRFTAAKKRLVIGGPFTCQAEN